MHNILCTKVYLCAPIYVSALKTCVYVLYSRLIEMKMIYIASSFAPRHWWKDALSSLVNKPQSTVMCCRHHLTHSNYICVLY